MSSADDDNAQSSTHNDELVSSFMSFTGSADPGRAASYLEMSGGDLQTAVGLYLEHEQGGGSDGMGGRGSMGGLGSSGGAAAVGPGLSNASASGAPMMGGVGSGGMMMDDEWDVRAPDQTQTMRLMDDQMMSVDPTFHLMNAMMEEQLAQSAFAASPPVARSGRLDARAAVNAAANAAGGGNDDDGGSDNEYNYEDDDDEDDEVQIVPGPRVPVLSDMFAAPTHLIHKAGGFAGARAVAKDSKRWLLVNIQRDSEFSSHALNRDVWRDELVENLIREGFIFWQAMDQAPDGQTFVERYQVHDFPHISIIDPRTGRLLWRKEGWTQQNPVTAESFAEMAMDFCSRNSFDRLPQAPRPGGGSTTTSSAGPRPSQKRPVQEMTEDEQLQAAMRASINDLVPGGGGGGGDDAEVVEVMEEDDRKPAPSSSSQSSLVGELLGMPISDEPPKGARLQLKMPDGKRVVRRFAPTDTVKTIYAFVAQSNEECRNGREFTVMAGFPPSDLILDLDRSIEECNLSGQAITVRWKE